jgi:hypothetical protein
MKQELEKKGLAYIWRNKHENKSSKLQSLRNAAVIIERQDLFSMMRETISFDFYQKAEYTWGKEHYTEWYTRKERNDIARMNAGIWKLRWLRRGTDNGGCSLCLRKGDVKYIPQRCLEAKIWEQNF